MSVSRENAVDSSEQRLSFSFQRYCSSDDPKRLQSVLAEMHGHYVGTKPLEAEHKFIQVSIARQSEYQLIRAVGTNELRLQICQRHRDFGAHLHRVFRNKPSGTHGAAPFDPDTGAALWIAIMPRGIGIYEEQVRDVSLVLSLVKSSTILSLPEVFVLYVCLVRNYTIFTSNWKLFASN